MSVREARRRRQEGAAAVEFALVAPLLLLLLFGIISYGYMLSFRQAISQAAAEGARAAAVAPRGLSASDLTTRAHEAINEGLGSYGVTCASGLLMKGAAPAGTCSVSPPQACNGSTIGAQCVKVTLSYTYADDPLLPSFPGLDLVLPDALTFTTETQVS